MQRITFTINDQSMTCVVTALKTDHRVKTFIEKVDNFPLALVAPLSADYYHIAFGLHKSPTFEWIYEVSMAASPPTAGGEYHPQESQLPSSHCHVTNTSHSIRFRWNRAIAAYTLRFA